MRVAGDRAPAPRQALRRDREPARLVRRPSDGQSASLARHRRGRLLREPRSVVEHAVARIAARPARRARLSRRLLADVTGDLCLVRGRLCGRADDRACGRRQEWTALVPVVVMPFATILLVAGYSTRNPTAVGMERSARADDPAPGILRVTRHPVMWAIGLWAIEPCDRQRRSELAAVFRRARGLWPSAATVLIDRKKQLALGSNWPRLAEVTSNLPFAALVAGRTGLRWREIGLLADHRRSAALRRPLPRSPDHYRGSGDGPVESSVTIGYGGSAMLLPLAGRRLYYDLVGPEDGPVVCITHSLASDGGMWAEQMPPLLQAGFRVLRSTCAGTAAATRSPATIR